MSQEAYELLLEANELYSQDKRDEAIRAYREVLRLDPSPNQRQVAEDQLRALGELPYTFSSSGKIIRRKTAGAPGKSGKQRRRTRPAQMRQDETLRPRRELPASRRGSAVERPRPSSPRTPLPMEDGGAGLSSRATPSTPSPATPAFPSPSPGWSGPSPWAGGPPPPSQRDVPPTRSEKVLSVLDNMFTEPGKESGSQRRSQPAPRSRASARKKSAVTRGRVQDQAPPKAGGKGPQDTAQSGKKKKASRASEEPVRPQRHEGESDEAFARRMERYQIWEEAHQTHPHIDLNTALRLHETGWTLEELRAYQKERRQSYLQRKEEHLQQLAEENEKYTGTQFMENLVREELPLWVLCANGNEMFATLKENELYQWKLEDENGKVRTLHKLQILCTCEKVWQEELKAFARLDAEQEQAKETPPKKPCERAVLDDEVLLRSLEEEEPLAFQLYSGVWFWGWVYWYDPYQLSLVLNIDAEEDEDLVEVMMFRHAVKCMEEQLPLEWENFPTLAELNNM